MKNRIIILFVALFAIISNANAQFIESVTSSQKQSSTEEKQYFSTQKGKTRFTYNFYYGMSQAEGINDGNFNIGFEYLWGYNVINNMFLEGGLGWHTGFVGFKSGSDYYDTKMTINETILNIPVHLGYNLSFGGRCSLDLYTGPRANYRIAGSRKYKEGGNSEKIKYKDFSDYDLKIERFYVDWNIGAGLMFGSWGLNVEYRAALGDSSDDFLHLGIRFVY